MSFTNSFGRRAAAEGGPATGGTEIVWRRLSTCTTDATERLTALLAAARATRRVANEGSHYTATLTESYIAAAWLLSHFGDATEVMAYAAHSRLDAFERERLVAAIMCGNEARYGVPT